MLDKLPAFEMRLEALDRQLMDPAVASDGRKVREVSREAAYVRDVVDAFHALQRQQNELNDAKELLASESDAELREMAREEIGSLEEQIEASTAALRLLLLPRDPYEGRPIMLEIRAGTGGDEAALFAGDLLRMYQRFADANGLRLEVMSKSDINVGGGSGKSLQGLKEVVAAVSGDAAYSLLRFEAGTHRVQRVPATESQGRIHTSAATVAVLPEPEEVELKIEDKDLRIDTMRAGGPGGQSVNTT
ncbi:MAG: PCRF domain-containing protein, partial [Myxococcota bacterium]